MISRGVEISIAGGVVAIVRDPIPWSFFFPFFFFFFFLFSSFFFLFFSFFFVIMRYLSNMYRTVPALLSH